MGTLPTHPHMYNVKGVICTPQMYELPARDTRESLWSHYTAVCSHIRHLHVPNTPPEEQSSFTLSYTVSYIHEYLLVKLGQQIGRILLGRTQCQLFFRGREYSMARWTLIAAYMAANKTFWTLTSWG